MALDFHTLDTEEYLFGLDDEQYNCLSQVLETFYQWTGLGIDRYKNMQLTTENCRTLLQIIDNYVEQTDLNKDKRKTIGILGFRGLLEYFIGKKISFRLRGD
jgi:hypothetical protein